VLDVVLHGKNEGRSTAAIARETGLTEEQVDRAMRDIDRKRMTTRYMHLEPQLVEPVPIEVAGASSPSELKS